MIGGRGARGAWGGWGGWGQSAGNMAARPVILALGALVAALLAWAPVARAQGVPQEPSACLERPGRSVVPAEIIDGDTVILGEGRTVRLTGIEAPKRVPGAPASTRLEDLTRDRLERLVRAGRVRLVTDQDESDRYGRLLGDLFVLDGDRIEWV